MPSIQFGAPLAKFEETDILMTSVTDNEKSTYDGNVRKYVATNAAVVKGRCNVAKNIDAEKEEDEGSDDEDDEHEIMEGMNNEVGKKSGLSKVEANFKEPFRGSLQDLVNTFDEKISKCFYNYQESVETLAPAQIRTQEDIMNECQMWWTITGSFGNILPIDWSKSYSCKLHIPSLKLGEEKGDKEKHEFEDCSKYGQHLKEKCGGSSDENKNEDESAIAYDLDMHSLMLPTLDNIEPVKTAEEVLKEIDDIIQGTEVPDTPSRTDAVGHEADACESLGSAKEFHPSEYYEKMKSLGMSQLNEIYLELELLIKEYSETLVAELALRDELEFQKELKNSFISLLLAVQNKRRQYHVEKKKNSKSSEPKYLTTVIPYHADNGPLPLETLQILIKILKAINEDSPIVPTLLTDYILKVLCPT